MNGPQHFRRAEELLRACVDEHGNPLALHAIDSRIDFAYTHALLATASAIAQLLVARCIGDEPHINAWRDAWAEDKAGSGD
jgi:hypothetical protein